MNEKEKDIEELDLLVDKLELDNWNARIEKSEASPGEAGTNLKIGPDE